jgi:hypothetical protein
LTIREGFDGQKITGQHLLPVMIQEGAPVALSSLSSTLYKSSIKTERQIKLVA